MRTRKTNYFKKTLRMLKRKFAFWSDFQLGIYVNDVYLGSAD